MRYKLIEFHGFEAAVLGMMLSYGKTNYDSFDKPEDFTADIKRVSEKLAPMDGGHNKFLEQIQYWVAIQAPLFWWKQFDTYRIGVSKSSESTMHKSWKKGLTQEMFEQPIFQETLSRLNCLIKDYNKAIEDGKTDLAKELETTLVNNLPDGYLQTRMVNLNAKTIRNIYFQRKEHKLKQWRDFCRWIESLPHGDLITAQSTKD